MKIKSFIFRKLHTYSNRQKKYNTLYKIINLISFCDSERAFFSSPKTENQIKLKRIQFPLVQIPVSYPFSGLITTYDFCILHKKKKMKHPSLSNQNARRDIQHHKILRRICGNQPCLGLFFKQIHKFECLLKFIVLYSWCALG